jgi:hypothetical protein
METFKVSLTSTTVEVTDADIEANSAEEAKQIMLSTFQEGTGAYESDFCIVAGHTSVDLGDEEKLIKLRVLKIERLVAVADYEGECAVRDLLTDLRHYCDAKGIVWMTEDNAAYQHYLHELHFDE